MTSPRTFTRMLRRLDRERQTKRTDQPHRYVERRRALAVARQIAQELKQGRARR